jgi:hypothetical protein
MSTDLTYTAPVLESIEVDPRCDISSDLWCPERAGETEIPASIPGVGSSHPDGTPVDAAECQDDVYADGACLNQARRLCMDPQENRESPKQLGELRDLVATLKQRLIMSGGPEILQSLPLNPDKPEEREAISLLIKLEGGSKEEKVLAGQWAEAVVGGYEDSDAQMSRAADVAMVEEVLSDPEPNAGQARVLEAVSALEQAGELDQEVRVLALEFIEQEEARMEAGEEPFVDAAILEEVSAVLDVADAADGERVGMSADEFGEAFERRVASDADGDRMAVQEEGAPVVDGAADEAADDVLADVNEAGPVPGNEDPVDEARGVSFNDDDTGLASHDDSDVAMRGDNVPNNISPSSDVGSSYAATIAACFEDGVGEAGAAYSTALLASNDGDTRIVLTPGTRLPAYRSVGLGADSAVVAMDAGASFVDLVLALREDISVDTPSDGDVTVSNLTAGDSGAIPVETPAAIIIAAAAGTTDEAKRSGSQAIAGTHGFSFDPIAALVGLLGIAKSSDDSAVAVAATIPEDLIVLSMGIGAGATFPLAQLTQRMAALLADRGGLQERVASTGGNRDHGDREGKDGSGAGSQNPDSGEYAAGDDAEFDDEGDDDDALYADSVDDIAAADYPDDDDYWDGEYEEAHG